MKQPKPRHKDRLTVKRHILKNLKPGKYVDGGGLALLVSEIGSKSWVFRFERDGRDRATVIGSLRDLTLDQARDEAAKLREQLKAGVDPIDAKREAKNAKAQQAAEQVAAAAKSKTFEQAAQEYYDDKSHEWTSAHYRAKFLTSLRMYAFPKIGALPLEAINTALVKEVLAPIWLTKNPTADRVRGRIENIMDWAIALGIRTDNPARWAILSKLLSAKNQSVIHHKALSYEELPEFVAELTNSPALEFLILTAARSGEVLGARWSEIELRAVPVETMDDDGRPMTTIMGPCWIIPGPRMKEKKVHRVPLSARAVEILNGQPRQGEFVFSRNGKPLGKNTFLDLLETMGRDVTPHGFRSSFRSWAAARKFADNVCELALSHSVGNNTQKAYQRDDLFDLRRPLMAEWANYCLSPPRGDDNVVPFRETMVS